MRITENLMVNRMLQDLGQAQDRLLTSQQQLATGKVLNKPSDDPVNITKDLSLRTSLAEAGRYLKTVDDASGWLQNTEGALAAAESILQRARELAVQGANGALDNDSRQALTTEANELLKELVNIGNTNYDGRYIFGGQKTTTEPFVLSQTSTGPVVTYQGDRGALLREIGPHVTMAVNTLGDDAFTPAFTAVINLVKSLAQNDTASLSGSVLNDIGTAEENVLVQRAEIGARTNRLERMRDYLRDTQTDLGTTLSGIEDADLSQVIVTLQAQQNMYTAALGATARVLVPSLLDFLR